MISTSAAALHSADEGGPATSQRALVVWYAGIEVARGPVELDRHAHSPAGAPAVEL